MERTLEMELYFPKGEKGAFERCTCLCVAAHSDDAEITAYPFIEEQRESGGFGCVIVTNGEGGNPHGVSDIITVRKNEQKKAARAGNYAFAAFLEKSSAEVYLAQDELAALILKVKPETLLTHSLFDRHKTHVKTAKLTIETLKAAGYAPKRLLGLESSSPLGWLPESVRIAVAARGNAELISLFESQKRDGRDFARGVLCRAAANGVFSGKDGDYSPRIYSLDMLPALETSAEEYLRRVSGTFLAEALGRLK